MHPPTLRWTISHSIVVVSASISFEDGMTWSPGIAGGRMILWGYSPCLCWLPKGFCGARARLGRLCSAWPLVTQMYGPAARCKRLNRSVGVAVLHQCIRPLIGACCAPGHHGYQRACVLISGQASNGPFGSPGFAGAGKTGPPSRFILSQTSAGKRGLSHHSLLIGAVPLFVP
jgi:hypothetical protein